MTNLNQQILTMIQSSEGHLTAEEAFMLAKKNNINVSMASIYRILGRLAENGYIRRIKIADNPDVFDKTLSNHEHLRCIKCGKMMDAHINDFKKVLIKQTGVDIDSYELCINYVCDDCKKES